VPIEEEEEDTYLYVVTFTSGTCTLQLQLHKRCKRVIVVVAGESVFLCYLKFGSSMSPDKTWGKSLFY
jgi:hypothetical protein